MSSGKIPPNVLSTAECCLLRVQLII